MSRKALYNADETKKIGEHYYCAGGHVYEFIRGRGQRRAKVCFICTPACPEGEYMAWEERNGYEYYELMTAGML